MTLETFRSLLHAAAPPPGMDLAMQALWWGGKHDWPQAHACAQQNEGDPACDWVHAHLHRVEGDQANAAYWYRRAGKPVATNSLEQEWETIARSLLAR